MTLVETFPGESDADFRAAMDAILQAVSPDRPNWWHPYEIRGTYEYSGIRFRDFSCIAGSVEAWIWMHANKGGLRRVIMVPDRSLIVFGGVTMVGGGTEVPVAKEQIAAVGPERAMGGIEPTRAEYVRSQRRQLLVFIWIPIALGVVTFCLAAPMVALLNIIVPHLPWIPKDHPAEPAIQTAWLCARFITGLMFVLWAVLFVFAPEIPRRPRRQKETGGPRWHA